MNFVLFRRLTLRGYRWFWHLKAGNGEIIAHSEGYHNKDDALDTIQAIIDLRADTLVRIEGR